MNLPMPTRASWPAFRCRSCRRCRSRGATGSPMTRRRPSLVADLFFDARLSASGKIACSTCHRPELYFTDGRARAQGLGATRRSAPSIVGAAYSPWQFWDGRKDSLWSQALEPIEHLDEQGVEPGRSRSAHCHALSRPLPAHFWAPHRPRTDVGVARPVALRWALRPRSRTGNR